MTSKQKYSKINLRKIQELWNFLIVFPSIMVKGVDEMKKLSIVLALIMLVGMFSSCEGIGDETLQIDSYAPKFDVSYEPLPKREYRRGETFTITTCVTNISGKDLTYSAVINSYYPTLELHSQSENAEVSAIINPEPIDTVSGSEEFTAKAGQVGKKTFTFIIPEDAVSGVYSIDLNYRGNVCTYKDAIVILDKPKHTYSASSVSSGDHKIYPISVLDGYYYFKNEEKIWTEEIGYWKWIFSDSSYDPDNFPTIVLDGEIAVQMPENVSFSAVEVYDTDGNILNYAFELFSDLTALPAGEYVIASMESVKTDADGPHSPIGEYDYKLTKFAFVFKLIVR